MTISCAGCGAQLVTAERVAPLWHTEEVGDHFNPIGWKVTLAPGFKADRHPRRYVRSRNPLAPGPKVRTMARPFVVTCRCGRDMTVDSEALDTNVL